MFRTWLFLVLLAPLAWASDLPQFSVERHARSLAPLFPGEELWPAQNSGSTESEQAARPMDSGPGSELAAKDTKEPRPIYDWYGRGFGISLVGTGALVFPGGGVGLEVCMPIHQRVGLLVRGGVLGSVFFEGTCFDFGVRAYYDTSRNFTLYHDVGFRVLYGRILGYFGNDLENVIHRFGVGGFSNLGLEVSATWIRFFAEVGINGAKTLGERFEVLFFIGLNFGIRFYIGG